MALSIKKVSKAPVPPPTASGGTIPVPGAGASPAQDHGLAGLYSNNPTLGDIPPPVSKPSIGGQAPAADSPSSVKEVIPVATISVTKKGEEEKSLEATLPPVISPVSPAVVSVSMGVTMNIGNYNSVKISVALSLPCVPDPSEIDETYAAVRDWVQDQVGSLSESVRSEAEQ